MNDERLVDIESRLAHQERMLEELNDALTGQQASIMKLEELCRTLVDRLRDLNASLAEARPGPGDERPPHY